MQDEMFRPTGWNENMIECSNLLMTCHVLVDYLSYLGTLMDDLATYLGSKRTPESLLLPSLRYLLANSKSLLMFYQRMQQDLHQLCDLVCASLLPNTTACLVWFNADIDKRMLLSVRENTVELRKLSASNEKLLALQAAGPRDAPTSAHVEEGKSDVASDKYES